MSLPIGSGRAQTAIQPRCRQQRKEGPIQPENDLSFKPALQLAHRRLELWRRTLIMGILNITPDSFSDGGLFLDADAAVAHGLEMVKNGADILDLGGESTRPGSEPVSPADELKRVLPVLSALRQKIDIPISVDTYKSSVAEVVLKNGAEIINDISGFHFDKQMPEVVQQYRAAAVLMHIKGTPRTMQINPHYDDLVAEISAYLQEGINRAEAVGIHRNQLAIDPGIGFGKSVQDNYLIIKKLNLFHTLSCAVLIGPSRKSFIGKFLDLPETERIHGTAAAVACSIMNGANIVRVHDVRQMKQVARIADAVVGKPEASEQLDNFEYSK